MTFLPQQYRPDTFTQFLVEEGGLCRIVAHAEDTAAGSLSLDSIKAAITEFLVERKIRKATCGIIFTSNRIDESQIRLLVSNLTQGRLTCVWAIGVNNEAKSFVAIHTAFKVSSTRFFEDKIRALVDDQYHGI